MRRPGRSERKIWLRLRLWGVGAAFSLVYLVLVGQAMNLQILEEPRLTQLAEGEFIRQDEIAPRRGVIYDRNQEELAVSLDTDSVYARPRAITEPKKMGVILARALDLPARQVVERLTTDKGFVWLARRLSPDKARNIQELQATAREAGDKSYQAVGLVREPKRFYPNTYLASQVLGFSGLDARGLEGLELGYDRTLRGEAHTATSLRDALGRLIYLSPEDYASLPEGHQLILTLDKQVQYHVEKELAQAVTQARAKGGQAVVMIPSTGEILAMASVPTFNPNVFGEFPRDTYRNRIITDAYEPGSTFKVFVAASALTSGKVSLERTFDCEEGAWRMGGRTIHDTHHYGLLNLADIVKFSSNIGAGKVALELGPQTLGQTLKDFGFGRPTGIDLPGEAGGILRNPKSWRPLELANIAFGQGVAVTALQLTQAIAAVANRGIMMKPFVVKAVVDNQARLVRENQPQLVRRVMGAREARILTQMLSRVTEDGGTGPQARVAPFTVAGKTGTAQKLNPGGGYSHSDYMASFVGFLPAEDPAVVVLVVIDTPRGSHYGGIVAAPAFANIARAALDALGVKPPRETPILEASAPPAGKEIKVASLETAAGDLAQGLTPDLTGLSLRQVLTLVQDRGVELKAAGWGRVVEQQPNPGSPLAGEPLAVRLAPPHGGV
ncbi:MAG: PASTA domain-containing protein [Deltaproteobacteria bacterium]|nr:PASTA domain-containing protein [Deltaproteobacteria bacterium]